MDTAEKIGIIKSDPCEEIITEESLRELLDSNQHPKHYFGLEISGMLHVGHVLVAGKKVNDFARIGAETNILLADWHSIANKKLGGDWEKILEVGKFYKEIFGVFCPKAKIIFGSELYDDNDDYWKTVMSFSTKVTMARATRTVIIEGRKETDKLYVSQYMYPIMQAADIHALDIDIPHAGMDQRKAHMLAKELFKESGMKSIVPVHNSLLLSLLKPEAAANESKEERNISMKMSKSRPGSYLSIVASEEEVYEIVGKGYCPEGVADENPVLGLCRQVIIPINKVLKIERDAKYGGDIEYKSYADIERDFSMKKLHPADLKKGVAAALNEIIGPIRKKLGSRRERFLELASA